MVPQINGQGIKNYRSVCMSDSDQKSYYEKNGIQYPRTTHILGIIEKPGLARWRGRVGNAAADLKSQEGRKIGNDFHLVAADINRGLHQKRGWQPPGELRIMAFNYIEWLHKNIEKILSVEKTVYSDEYLYGGTMDLEGILRGDQEPSIIDIKTSTYVDLSWPLQLSAYKRAAEEEDGMPRKRRIIAHVPKDGKPVRAYEYKNHDEDDKTWLSVLNIWNWAQKDKERQKSSLVVVGFD